MSDVRAALTEAVRAVTYGDADVQQEHEVEQVETFVSDIVEAVEAVYMAADRAETTTVTDEDADEVIEEAVEEALHTYGHVRSGGFDGDHYIVDGLLSEVVRAVVHTLNERGLLATARTRPAEQGEQGEQL